MAFRAIHRFAQISPQKVRPLADLIRGKYASEALNILRYQPQRGARMLEKVLQGALGNAQNADHPDNRGRMANTDDLVVIEAVVNQGPMFKRIRPRARGMAFGIKKRMSHIAVTLEEMEDL